MSSDRLLRLGLLGSLGPEFHHEEHQPVNPNYKDNNNARVSPSKIFLCEVQCTEVISTLGVLAHATVGVIVRVEKIRAHPHAALVDVKVLATRLIRGGVKYSQFLRLAMNRFVPGSEDQQGTHKVVEGVDVVHPVEDCCQKRLKPDYSNEIQKNHLPVSPERFNLAVWDHDAAE